MMKQQCLIGLFLNIFLIISIKDIKSISCWEINNELADRVMLKAIQELSYPQDRNSTWLPDIQLPIFSQYRLQLEKGKLSGLKFAKRIGNGIVHKSNSTNLVTLHIVFGLPQLQFSYNAGARYFMIFGNNWQLTGNIDLLVVDLAFDVIADGSRKGIVDNIFKADHRYLINLQINGFDRSLYRYIVTESLIKQKISEVLQMKLNELSEIIKGMSFLDLI